MNMKKVKYCVSIISTAFVLNGVVKGEGKGDALNKGNHQELVQSEKLVESAGKALIKQAEAGLKGGVLNLLDVLNVQLSVLESQLSILNLNDYIDISAPSRLRIEEKKRSLVTEIKGNLEAQIQILKLNCLNGLIGPKKMMLLELKLNLFLLEKHELMGLNESLLERQVFDLMAKLSKLREEELKQGVGV